MVSGNLQALGRDFTIYSWGSWVSRYHRSLGLFLISFFFKGTWTVDALSTALSSTPSAVRKHLSHWVGQGILKEDPNDLFTVIERQSEGIQGCVTG